MKCVIHGCDVYCVNELCGLCQAYAIQEAYVLHYPYVMVSDPQKCSWVLLDDCNRYLAEWPCWLV